MGEGWPRLPEGFVFGTSTAAYQIEGAATEDGRGPSIWDTFAAQPGRIVDGSDGSVACDHYHRCRDDVGLMARLGAQGYRFSIAWSRIQPDGSGAANPAGLGFYDRLVDELLAHGIAPMATLYHWDLPQALEDAGGWLSRDTAERFAEYAGLVADRLADRVAHWVPVNEPNVASLLGYALGMHAPGKALMFDALPAAHHLLLGHGLAVRALRAAGATAVGTANNHAPIWPASDSEPDRAAADLFDTVWNKIFADPILLGRYPDGFEELMGVSAGSTTGADDLAIIGQPLDFYGVNYYNPMCVAAPADPASAMPFDQREITGYPKTDFGWPVVPDGLRELLVLLDERYPSLPPVMITENGCSYGIGPEPDGDGAGVVDDQPRIDYLDSHLRAVAAAIGDGVDVRGYYCWSLLDNFEWTEGYTQRFGLVHVDYETQARTPKRSFDWYAETIRSQP